LGFLSVASRISNDEPENDDEDGNDEKENEDNEESGSIDCRRFMTRNF